MLQKWALHNAFLPRWSSFLFGPVWFQDGYRARQGPQQCGETWKELLENAARWEPAPERHHRGMVGQGTSERDSWQQLIGLVLSGG
jgi:hypothetical protein